MKKHIVTLAVASLVLTNLSVYAFGPEGEPPPPAERHMKKKDFKKMEKKRSEQIKKELGLTDEQAERAKALRENSRKKLKPLFEKMREANYKMKKLDFSDASERELKKQWDEIFTIKQQIRKIQRENLEEFESILTPEQTKKFEKIKEEKKAKHLERKLKRKNKKKKKY